ncbi:hypothetical protein IEQ34_008308 [Dendrobium chrysotoxum]|uniref:Uncharacterized protein n=1 Tax=Dendrobium chrysotoxum TaxID=161865 RepID=A0AAV7GYX5_DENCH|nr:hypothetical protein IEQ34_008308 [Dendrobium chrysotoxum]
MKLQVSGGGPIELRCQVVVWWNSKDQVVVQRNSGVRWWFGGTLGVRWWSSRTPLTGQQRKGTPFLTASMVEFQPQCDMKQAIAGCFRTFCCGDQPTILPRSATLSLNPEG